MCRSKGENNSEVFKIVVMRREGPSQVFGVVQLMVLSLPAMQREKERWVKWAERVGIAEMCRRKQLS